MFSVSRRVALLLVFAMFVSSFAPLAQAVKGYGRNSKSSFISRETKAALSPIFGLAATGVCAVMAIMLRLGNRAFDGEITNTTDFVLLGGLRLATVLAMCTSLTFAGGSLISAVRLALAQLVPSRPRFPIL